MIKLREWELKLISLVVVPLLTKLLSILREKANQTETSIDDYLIGCLEVVIDVLLAGNLFIEQK